MGPLSPEAGSTGYVNKTRSAGADRFLGRGRPMADDSRDLKVGRYLAGYFASNSLNRLAWSASAAFLVAAGRKEH